MPRQRVLLSCLAGLLGYVWLGASAAAAQEGGADIHLGAGFALDVGGEVDFDVRGADRDLDATVGLRGHLDYAVHRYVSVGGLVRMSWWEPDDWALDRSFLFDLGPRVIGHYDWRDFRFYAGLSPGIMLSAINDDDDDGFRGVDFDNPAVGFTMSLTVAGAEWWFSKRLGVFAEIGWVGHWFEHDQDNFDGGDVEFELSQMMLESGLVFGI